MATRVAHLREALPLTGIRPIADDTLYLAAKRLLDIVVALALLIVLAPLMALIALAIALDSRGPIIFRQQRVRGEQDLGTARPAANTFEFLKFRTMYVNADQNVHRCYVEQLINGAAQQTQAGDKKLFKLQNDRRITRVGALLRKTSLDELPQLWNVVRGDMTLVGPRPAIPYEVQQYKPWHLARLTVRGGLTGLWQVMGRNELTFDDMVQLDITYARTRNLWLDLKIILATIPAVVHGRGVC